MDTTEWCKQIERGMFWMRDFEGGQMSRDMTIFIDDDGKAYHFYSSEENLTLYLLAPFRIHQLFNSGKRS